MADITLYGISNCDTVKKSRAWLAGQGVAVTWHDFKKQGVPVDALARWIVVVGWEKLLNRQGTAWRKLDDSTQAAVTDTRSAMALMQSQSSVIKRPVVEWGDGRVTVGFSEEVFRRHLA
jgi:Spx/MgsR family transcriptional regulator